MCMSGGGQKRESVPTPPAPQGAASGMGPTSGAGDSPRWQDKYADPAWKDKLTKLSPEEETKFQDWAAKNNAPITEDYDMRGFWRDGGASSVNRNDGQMHYTDTYKTPAHESFSGESKYSRQDMQKPKWNEKDQLVAPDGKVLFDEPAVVAERRKKAGNKK